MHNDIIDKLEALIRENVEFHDLIKKDMKIAIDLYSALCNNEWYDLRMNCYLISWRSAGALVASLREAGECYLDFYCSGNEGDVTDEIERHMNNSKLSLIETN